MDASFAFGHAAAIAENFPYPKNDLPVCDIDHKSRRFRSAAWVRRWTIFLSRESKHVDRCDRAAISRDRSQSCRRANFPILSIQ
jgi:hypothetical protein